MPTGLEKLRLLKENRENSDAELAAMANPTEGMSGTDRFVAGAGRGMANIGRNLGNIIGMEEFDDEALATSKRRDEALMDTKSGALGSFAGEVAALAPISLAGRGAMAAGSAAKAALAAPTVGRAALTNIPRLTGAGMGGLKSAAAQGAVAGGILSDPGERLSGATTGAVAGGVLNKSLGALGRKVASGFKESPAAVNFGNAVEKLIGRRPSLPVAQAARSTKLAYPYKSVVSMFPLARGGSKTMEQKTIADWTEAVLVQGFGKKNSGSVIAKFKETGSFADAVNYGLRNTSSRAMPANRKALKLAADAMKKSDSLDPNKLDTAARKVMQGEDRPFYELSSVFSKVLKTPLEESTVSGRRLYNKLSDGAGGALLGGAVTGFNPLAYGGATAGTWLASRPAMQNALMGRTVLNRAADRVGKASSPYAAMLRNQISAGD